MADLLGIRSAEECQFELVALGEVMLRLDPGEERITTARTFRAWEGGGEYNVARGLRRVFGLRTAIVTALVDNPVGHLIETLMLSAGVDVSHVRWVPFDGVGRNARNGLNFTERGFGVRGAVGCSDRGHTAASQLRTGDIDWPDFFERKPTRWFHCGGIFAGLSETTAGVAEEAMRAARESGAIVSYDLNFRPSLWQEIGGNDRAVQVNRRLATYVDVMFGNEEDFAAALGYEIAGADGKFASLDSAGYATMLRDVVADFPSLRVIATSLRVVQSASINDWGGICLVDGRIVATEMRERIEILDRVGGGDAFASGLIYGLICKLSIEVALEYAVAHGALAMTTPGDGSMATLEEVKRLAAGGSARAIR